MRPEDLAIFAAVWTALCLLVGFITGRYVAGLLEHIAGLYKRLLDNIFRWKYEDKLRDSLPKSTFIERAVARQEELDREAEEKKPGPSEDPEHE